MSPKRLALRTVHTTVATTIAIGIVGVAGCKRTPDPEAAVRAHFVAEQALAADAGVALRLTSSDEVFFDDGWNPLETTRDLGVHGDAWRWMAKTSLIRIRTHLTPMKLTITGWVPMHVLGSPPFLTLRWRGNRVDVFFAEPGRFSRTVAVSEAMQAGTTYADFMIETSATGNERDEPRDLGFAISDLRWEAAKD